VPPADTDGFHAPVRLQLQALNGIPLARDGDDVATLIAAALQRDGLTLRAGDAIVVAQKLISKCEGRLVALADVVASPRAIELAARTHKDPRLVELILRESTALLRVGREVLIVEHRNGFVLANAGIDMSNANVDGDDAQALLLPLDADASAEKLRAALHRRYGVACGVLIIDSIGRAWRRGTVGQTIGSAGLPVLVDLRGRRDLHGRVLRSSDLAHADELAAAASLLMGQADEGRPVVLVRGLASAAAAAGQAAQNARVLQRARDEDLFR
jgi:coenzyme F420-0:L-glutamate ligase/coenzyme F420-1:gamma-L-glutamate ligase